MGLFGNSHDGVVKQVLDNAADAIVYTDKKNRIRYVNASAERLFNKSASLLIGEDIGSLGFGAVQEGTTRQEMRSSDGSSVLLELSVSRIKVSGGDGWALFAKDISIATQEQQRVEQMLSQSVNSVVSIDGNNHVTYMNPAAEELWGYKADEVIGQNVKMLVPKELRGFHDTYVNTNRQTKVDIIVGTSRDVELERRDGSKIWANLSLSRTDVAGEIGYTAFARDITKEKIAREENEQVLRQAIDAVISIDQNNLVTFFNPAAEVLWGYTQMR
ncbi:PAS domain S-box protein [Enterovibrio nigricans]|uniref:PAS domain S-box-containing protein n=1 Tax=Enterovibrio nigricans DSM 22720 TaxID=1121868 RepID=A0A1T4VTU3_9GAMM|nr:PAS domain S-box protein [Enterovibrio nigricans]PKF48971.1 hypothetical protein AT251_22305 [Enterovibrio nigricans]SKA68412.1 PAS domain S-box-containing protein [Enterovibrio nigricans DSM 22720]